MAALDVALDTSYIFERRMQMVAAVKLIPPKTTRRQRKQDQTADHLSATAYRLFETHGYDAVSMEQVADVADVAKATLYKYFPVKEALIAHRFRMDIAAGMAARAEALLAHQTFDSRMRYLPIRPFEGQRSNDYIPDSLGKHMNRLALGLCRWSIVRSHDIHFIAGSLGIVQ